MRSRAVCVCVCLLLIRPRLPSFPPRRWGGSPPVAGEGQSLDTGGREQEVEVKRQAKTTTVPGRVCTAPRRQLENAEGQSQIIVLSVGSQTTGWTLLPGRLNPLFVGGAEWSPSLTTYIGPHVGLCLAFSELEFLPLEGGPAVTRG